uniref:tRNA-intron lyase n=1 Tax=Angiostrongylus cantonensis TaxID=6313 RepID=A0A0K0DL42_ANGCA
MLELYTFLTLIGSITTSCKTEQRLSAYFCLFIITTKNDSISDVSSSPEEYITIDYVNDCFFIFSEEVTESVLELVADLSQLREKWRMLAPSAVSSGDQAPYILAPEQVTLLVLYGAARVRESVINFNKNPVHDDVLSGSSQKIENEHINCLTSQEVGAQLVEKREKTCNVPGRTIIHFAKSKPGDVHAKYLVDFVLDDVKLSPLSIASLVRLATQVKKSLVVAIVASDSHQPQYIKFDWFKPYTEERE